MMINAFLLSLLPLVASDIIPGKGTNAGLSTQITAEITDGYEWPAFRYQTYSNLIAGTDGLDDSDDSGEGEVHDYTKDLLEALGVLGYTEDSWNSPGTADIEAIAFFDLSAVQKAAAAKLGFTESDWDCDQNHFGGYTWPGLEKYGLATHWEALGYNREIWEGLADPPATSNLTWAELDETQQDAAEELCYSEETWDTVPLDECTSFSHVQSFIDRAILSHTNKGNFQKDNNMIYIRLDACNGATLIPDNNQEGVIVRGITGREHITIACENEDSPCYLFGSAANAQHRTTNNINKMRGLFSVEKAASFTFQNIALHGRRSNKKNFATAGAWDRPLLYVRGVPDVSVSGSSFLHGQSSTEDDDGGGLIIQQGRQVFIRDSKFVGNTAARDGGCLYVDIVNDEDGLDNEPSLQGMHSISNSSVTLEDLVFTHCHAGRYGGGAYINRADALTLNDHVWFERCTAEQGGGGWFANDILRTTSLHSRCNDCDIVGSSSDDYNNNCGGGCAFVRIRCLNSPYLPPCGGCESNLILHSLHVVNAITGPQALRAAPVSVIQGDDANDGYCGGGDTPPPPTTTTTRLPPLYNDYKSSTGRSPVALDPKTEYYRLNIQDSLWCALTNY